MINIEPFVQRAHAILNPYVSGVATFLDRLDTPQGLKSTPLRSKPVDSYIRNILAVGVLNRIMRCDFLDTKRRVIVLPDCLKNYGDWECCKTDYGNESECTQCTPECLVYESMESFANHNTAIVLEPEDMDTYFAELRKKYGPVGIVGVACALTMLSGFAKTIKHRHPTQGVFLNYSSCAHHWAEPPYNTSYSLKRMAWVLNNNSCQIRDESNDRGETYSMEKNGLSPDDFYKRLDGLVDDFEKEYLPHFQDSDIYETCHKIQNIIVPDLITRDSA